MREKCALSHGSGVLGRDPRDSCRFWSPHVENVCTVTQIRLGEGGGGGDTIGGGGVGEPRTGIIYRDYLTQSIYYMSTWTLRVRSASTLKKSRNPIQKDRPKYGPKPNVSTASTTKTEASTLSTKAFRIHSLYYPGHQNSPKA